MSTFTERENQLFDILNRFKEENLEFIVIGGFAVSAFQPRSSNDVDLVITADSIDKFDKILQQEGYEKITDKKLDRGRFVEYQKDEELPVSVDLLVGHVQSRQTGASWSYKEITQEAQTVEVEGAEESVKVPIPKTELLMATKLHSGRLTDARDIVAMAEDVDFEQLADYVQRGDEEELQRLLEKEKSIITGENFEDAFKGEFSERELPAEQISQVADFLQEQIDRLKNE